MELNIREDTKTKLVFDLKGETHTFCNALKAELQQVKGVFIVTYKIDHPLIGLPTFHLETKGIEPRQAVKQALSSLAHKAKEFQKEVSKL